MTLLKELSLKSLNIGEKFLKFSENAKKGYKDTILRDITKCYIDLSIILLNLSKEKTQDKIDNLLYNYSLVIRYLRIAVDLKIISRKQMALISKENVDLKNNIEKCLKSD